MYATWLRPVCWLVGHTPVRWRHRGDGVLACGWHCLLCGYARARIRAAVTTPEADLRMRHVLDQMQAKHGRRLRTRVRDKREGRRHDGC